MYTTLTLKQQLEHFCQPELAKSAIAFANKLAMQNTLPTFKQLSAIAQGYAALHIFRAGIKVIEVSEAEEELYAQTDLSGVPVQEWHQSYPLMLVAIREALIGVLWMPNIIVQRSSGESEIMYPVHLLGFPFNGTLDHCHIHANIEDALSNKTPSHGSRSGLTQAIGRIALNAVLHLASYPDLYGRYPNANNKIRIRHKNGRGEMHKQELVPQIIKLKAPIERENRQHNENNVIHTGTGNHKRPHWRRGHWRRASIGHGRVDRKFVWIEPILINGQAVWGLKASTTVFVA
jgi:hypothetical protein